MQRTTLAAAAVVTLLVAAPVQAQPTDVHPIIGTWSLNHEASSFSPGSGPRAQTRRFMATDDGFIVSIRATVNPNGNPDFALARVRFDGEPYEVWTGAALGTFLASGARPGATAAFEVIDDRTVRLTQRNADGELMGPTPNTWQVSSDGNTLTVTTRGTNQNGAEVHNVEVFDRVQS